MKKFIVILTLVFFMFSSLSADFPEDKSKKIGLEIEDVDRIVLEVYNASSSGPTDRTGAEIDKVELSGKSTSTEIVKYFFFKISITSSHKILLKLSTKGPLTLEGGDEKIDYSLWHWTTFLDSDTDISNFPTFIDTTCVFGYNSVSQKTTYEEKNYYSVGNNGYLNINEPTWGYFMVSVEKSDIIGKSIGTYVTYIYLTAETTS